MINLWNSNIFENPTSVITLILMLLVVLSLSGSRSVCWSSSTWRGTEGRRGDRRDAHPFCYWWWWWKTWRSARPSWLSSLRRRLRTYLLRKSTGGGRDLLQYFLLLTFVSSVARLPTGRWKVNICLTSLHWRDAFTHCYLNFNGFHHFKLRTSCQSDQSFN